jgi:hypothetical protein
MNRQSRRATKAQARHTQKGLDQLSIAASKLKGLAGLPDALRDVQEILDGVNDARTVLASALSEMTALQEQVELHELLITKLFEFAGQPSLREILKADFKSVKSVDAVPTEPEA